MKILSSCTSFWTAPRGSGRDFFYLLSKREGKPVMIPSVMTWLCFLVFQMKMSSPSAQRDWTWILPVKWREKPVMIWACFPVKTGFFPVTNKCPVPLGLPYIEFCFFASQQIFFLFVTERVTSDPKNIYVCSQHRHIFLFLWKHI